MKLSKEIKICPVCGMAYFKPPAVSRKDNQTLICPDCGMREALSAIGCTPEEQDYIIMKAKENERHD